jgi:hypothetical protein
LRDATLLGPSVIASKAANEYHFKTGQRSHNARHWMFYFAIDWERELVLLLAELTSGLP